MSDSYVNLSLMVDVLIKAAYQACQIIHLSSLKHPKIVFKTQDDPVTQIDHTIQKSVNELLQKHFPGIKIVGEQKIDEIMVDSLLLSILNNPQIQFTYMQHIHSTFNPNLEDLTIFIDPLDCTRGYLSGKKWECTVLIGVAWKGVPVFGVIGHPYQVDQSFNKFQYRPRFIVGGTIFSNQMSYEYNGGIWNKLNFQYNNNITKKAAISSRRKNKHQKDLIQNLNLNTIQCGGSGNKIAKMLRGQVDVVIFLQSPTSTWDSCAGQAIVLGMKGVFTKPNASKIQYEFGKADQTNYQGFICCLDENFHKSIIQSLHN